MSPQELTLSICLFGLPALIFIVAIAGSRLRPELKRRAETWFLMPLFVVLTAAGAGVAALEHWWVQLAVAVLLFAVATERLVKRLREHRRAPQPL